MNISISLDSVFITSKKVVTREIMGELILIPLTPDIGEQSDDLYSLNDTGRAIWERIDGEKSVEDIIHSLSVEYDAPIENIEIDVIGIVTELLRRKIILQYAISASTDRVRNQL